jgi:hypothetical protein
MQLDEIGINPYDMKANDRRKILNHLYGDWFRSQGMKLGRDYYLSLTGFSGDYYFQTNVPMELQFKDEKKAMFFKLTWL